MKKIHRFIFDTELLEMLEITDEALLHQWTRVLKFVPSEVIEICDGRQREAQYRIHETGKHVVVLHREGEVRENVVESSRRVTLYASILKRDSFDWLVQKATECGVLEIMPLVTERTVKKRVKMGRLEEIAREAAEQSGRGCTPMLLEAQTLAEAFTHAKQQDINYFFHFEAMCQESKSFDVDMTDFSSLLRDASANRIGLFIGPEGGWTDMEVDLARKNGCHMASLGSAVFCGETASVLATYLATRK